MTQLETTPIKDGILANQVIIDAGSKLSQEYLNHKPPFKPQKPESPLKPFNFGSGDSMLENDRRQILEFKNGDRLQIQRNGGEITSLIDKTFNKIAIPGDGENLLPADAPMEMYRLSNGALYTRVKLSGVQTLSNDGSVVVIDDQGIREFHRGDNCTVFARKSKNILEYLETNDPFGPTKK